MSESFDLSQPDHFSAGAIGPPGERVFYLQAREDGQVVTLRCEKQQVAALAAYLDGLLNDLPPSDGPAPSEPFMEPVVDEWIIGSMGVAFDNENDRIVLVVEELVVVPDDADEATESALREGAASARFSLTRAQVAAFVPDAAALVAAGRPLCKFCGQPEDAGAHACPRMN